MARYLAFLRAVNVGGRTVRMAELRAHFEALGFRDVWTFIASGNVVFETDVAERGLEDRIERYLADALGFATAVFVRSAHALATVAAANPFAGRGAGRGGSSCYVIFLRRGPTAAAAKRVLALGSEADELHLAGRELWWLCHGSMRDSAVSGARIEKAVAGPVTVRNVNTVQRLVAKLGAPS